MLKANNFFNVIQYTLLMTLVNVAQLIIRNNNINCWDEQEEKMLKWCIFATLHFFAVKHLPTFKCFVSTSSSLCQYPKGLNLIFLQTQQNKQSYKLNSYIFYHAHKIEWKTQCASWVHCGMSMLEIACSVLKECFPDWRPFLVCLFVCLFYIFVPLPQFHTVVCHCACPWWSSWYCTSIILWKSRWLTSGKLKSCKYKACFYWLEKRLLASHCWLSSWAMESARQHR